MEEFFSSLLSTYASFFDWQMWWEEVITDPVAWGLIGTLVIMEGLLSADNALVLAVMVKHLPEKQRKKALTYGLLGAYIFRFLFIGIGVYLVNFWWIKLLGAGYLAWLVIKHFWLGEKDDEAKGMKKDSWLVRVFGVFWATVIAVEIMDIAFSIDSILAAFAISNKVWVLLLGGMIGILMMRTVAKLFLVLIDKIPELEGTAFILIGLIAIKMALTIVHVEIPHEIFFLIIISAFVVTFIIHNINKKKHQGEEQAAASREE
ncbi:YkoY family integral membrane protein [Bacillus capparidis]|nr:YkoY family integral membrane protein [Bacillus capparidis]